MRFVCAGDLHIGSGGDLAPGGPDERLLEMEDVLRQIVDAANELECPLLWAGDAWERRRPTPAEILVVKRQFDRLRNGAVVIPGNHDVEGFDRPTGYDLAAPGLSLANVPAIISRFQNGGPNYQIACLPWAPPSKLVALDDSVDRDELNVKLADGLLDIARGLFAEMSIVSGVARILLGHWSISGASTPAGIPTDQFREPVIPIGELAAIGFDAVVFGHIHRQQVLWAGDDPVARPIFYVGSPLALNFGEVGSDHGAFVLDLDGTRTAAYRLPLESRVLQTIDTNAVTISDEVQVEYRPVEPGATVKVRVRATEAQARRLDVAQLKRDLLDVRKAGHVWSIQVDVVRPGPDVRAGPDVDESIDDREALALWLEQAGLPVTDSLAARHAGYLA